VTGGKNGYGAKLTNIYSMLFEIETVGMNDKKKKKKFYQKFTDNMTKREPHEITDATGQDQYTCISFIPDFKRFGIDKISDDILALFKKRLYDIAMSSGLTAYFNDELVKENSFQKYVSLYFPEDNSYPKIFDVKTNERWQVCAVYDRTRELDYQHVSFVNGVCTSVGGTHVDHVLSQIIAKIKEAVEKKVKKIKIKNAMITDGLILFINSIIENPDFDTQTKEKLTNKPASFGSKFEASDKFIKQVIQTGIVDQIVSDAIAKSHQELSKTDGKKKIHVSGIPKLKDAQLAGGPKSLECALILTEGDSAAGIAEHGLTVCDADRFGVFPLRGKLVNVREKDSVDLMENKEITYIKQAMGLQHGKKYTDLKTSGLRYGSIIIMTDQDVDGSHIKGLIINFIHHFWPSLAKIDGFIQCLATPIVKLYKGKNILTFYSLPELDKWKKENNDKGWTVKYFKGLGTHDRESARECFKDITNKLIKYTWSEDKDEETHKNLCDDRISLAFDKKRADDRKEWLTRQFVSDIFIDNSRKEIRYSEFIDGELINFSMYANVRAIPNIMDGFKNGQRKVYYGSVRKNIYNREIKVAQLAGYIGEHTEYHHGEVSLTETIVNMAQNFVGSNNINLLLPNGQFGTRSYGGKNAAASRYIFTQLNSLGKKIFNEDDFNVLRHQFEDNHMIEPIYYCPIIPMILVNGAGGIGTGYSTDIYPCNPRDIISNIKRFLKNKELKAMIPWYRHFSGQIDEINETTYITRGVYEILDGDTVHITELPIGTWTNDYKDYIENICSDSQADTKRKQRRMRMINKKKKKQFEHLQIYLLVSNLRPNSVRQVTSIY